MADADALLDELRAEAATCRDCPLWEHGTQTVFGEGPGDARLVLMGEQPGDREDRSGRPFVGPAGRVLDQALEAAGIDRRLVYVTNAVKHFKWERTGKVRLHKKPNTSEIAACRHWWEQEVAAIQPRVLACLGVTAGQAVFGPSFRVGRARGTWTRLPSGVWATATVHPSSVLRAQERRDEEMASLVRDLEGVAQRLRE